MNYDQLWEARDSILALAAICANPIAGIETGHIQTALEAHGIADAWHHYLRHRNLPASSYWEAHQADCQALACYHLEKLAELIGWNIENKPETTKEL